MNTSSEYKKAVEIVRREIAAWDPYDLLNGGAPPDEFDAEVASVVSGLRGVTSATDLAAVISKVFSSQFEDEYFTPAQCMEFSSAMFAALQLAGVLPPSNSLQARGRGPSSNVRWAPRV